jgi:hypothetical protein
MKNSSDTTGNRTRDLPVCSAVLQLTAPPRDTIDGVSYFKESHNVTGVFFEEKYIFR